MVYVVLAEFLMAVAATFLLWGSRQSNRVVLVAIPTGMSLCAFLHGLSFGMLQVEGSRAPDSGLLAGFGVAIAIFPGIPMGLILGYLLRRRSKPECNGENPSKGGENEE